jgi:glycosyltransferase involved in cell wall biosynthesis
MKVIHITTSNKGGAGISALRLHEELLSSGIDSKLLSLYQFPSTIKEQYLFDERDYIFSLFVDVEVLFLKVLKRLNLYSSLSERYSKKYLKNRPRGFEHFSFPFSSVSIFKHPLVKNADIIHLHWVSDGFLDYKSFFNNCNKKVVWTLHDMNPFTGGCHHADGCLKFETSCSHCPQLKNTIDENFSEILLDFKKASLNRIKTEQLKITAPSQWLTSLSQKSSLFKRFRHYTIHNLADDQVFKFRSKEEARLKLNIPLEKKMVLFVAHNVSDKRKGIHFLIDALKRFINDDSILVCSVGSSSDLIIFDLQHKKMGYVNDENTMAELYASADVFVLPSVAENFPNTICESLMCGTPVVAFNVGGIPELVNDDNGVLVEPYNVDKLHDAIDFVLNNQSKFERLNISKNAFQQLGKKRIAKQFMDLYSQIHNVNA